MNYHSSGSQTVTYHTDRTIMAGLKILNWDKIWKLVEITWLNTCVFLMGVCWNCYTVESRSIVFQWSGEKTMNIGETIIPENNFFKQKSRTLFLLLARILPQLKIWLFGIKMFSRSASVTLLIPGEKHRFQLSKCRLLTSFPLLTRVTTFMYLLVKRLLDNGPLWHVAQVTHRSNISATPLK
jgi:hypothetical protein